MGTKTDSKVFDNLARYFINEDNEGQDKFDKIVINKTLELIKPNDRVLDVGTGSAGLVKELLDNGVSFCTGIDLSSVLINSANTRLQGAKYSGKFSFFVGDFVYQNLEKSHSIILLNGVLCCSNTPLEMIRKAVELEPSYIIYRIPRSKLVLRFLLRVVHIFKIMSFFHIHNQKQIEKELEKRFFRKFYTKNFFTDTVVVYKNSR